MKGNTLWIAILLAMLVAAPLYAEDKAVKNVAELSYLDTSGNTETTTFKAKNTLTWAVSPKTSLIWLVRGLYGESDGEKNAEQYATELRGDYLVTDRLYTSLIGGWLQDEFAGIDTKYYVGPALGYFFLKGPKHVFKSEVEVDYVNEEYIDDTSEDYAQGSVFAEYEYTISDKNKFTQSAKYSVDLEDGERYEAKSVTALIYGFNSTLSLKTSYEVTYVNRPVPSTLEKTDKIFSTTLIINY